jgi:PAS domain S-box-containing protein
MSNGSSGQGCMKILYIATERQAAQGAAHSLRGIAPQIALSWARNLTSALKWIHDNRDVTAVIVEAEPQRRGIAAFTEDLRSAGTSAAVVVAAREQPDLPEVLSLALERTRAAIRDAAICTELQSRLFELEAASESLTDKLRVAETALAEECDIRVSLEHELDEARTRSAQERTAFDNSLSARDEEIAQIGCERERLQRLLADRDAELHAGTARHAASQQASQHALAQVEERLNLVSAAGKLEAGRLQQELDAARRELKTRLAETETLRGEMTRIPLLEMQLEQGKKEARRQFERAPYPICRCMRDGRIIQVNHSFARLLGYRKADDLRDKDLATLFECGNDLRWLIECSTKAETADAVETTWQTTDQRRLHVRLFAHVATGGSIEIAVENITGLREVEDRLRQAHRMEAVGRLASEVAVNCESLLRDGEVTRAAGLLRQFSVYGDRQISALEPVSVQRVLRNLGPVLKRLAGDNVRFVLPKTSASFDVDVDAERVERILVNVASYARDRMPHGGRVKIDLATTVVDRRFLARYPNVRPGAHVLLTVTEVRGAMRSVLTIAARPHPKPETMPPTSAGSGVDLGGLLGLIADCEGHLWMAAEPSGNMTLKIYLPCRESGAASEAAPAARAGRGSQLARWFRH